MYCTACGKANSENAIFCYSCGTRLHLEAKTAVQAPLRPKSVSHSTLLLEDNAMLRRARVGFPTKVRALLYNDHVEIHDKSGDALLDTPLSNLTDLKIRTGSLVSFTVNAQYYSLDFTPLSRRMGFGAFGALGTVVGEMTNPHKDTAHTWLDTIRQYSTLT